MANNKYISELPRATELKNEGQLIIEQDGQELSLSGEQLKEYVGATEIVQETGNSPEAVMSQGAVTNELNKKASNDALFGSSIKRINLGENTAAPQYFKTRGGGANVPQVTIIEDTESPVKDDVGYVREFSATVAPTGAYYDVAMITLDFSTFNSLSVSYWLKESEFRALTSGNTPCQIWLGLTQHTFYYEDLFEGKILNTTGSTASNNVSSSKCEHRMVVTSSGWIRVEHNFTEILTIETPTSTTPIYFTWTDSRSNIPQGMKWSITDLTLLLDSRVEGTTVYSDNATLVGSGLISEMQYYIAENTKAISSIKKIEYFLKFKKEGSNLYIGNKWDTDRLYINNLILRDLGFVTEPNIQMSTTYLGNKDNLANYIQILKSESDDDAPNVIYGYIGGNHGYAMTRIVVANLHNKTLADVGSVFTQAGKEYVLVRIIDENRLHFVSLQDDWTFTYPSIGEMIYSRNGNNTTNVIGTEIAAGSPHPSLTQTSIKIYKDGEEVEDDGDYEANNITISETYTMSNLPEIIKSIVDNRPESGYTEDVYLTAGYDLAAGEFIILREYDKCGSLTITQTFTSFLNSLDVSQFNVIQATSNLLTTGESFILIPKTKAAEETDNKDFSIPMNWDSPLDSAINFSKGYAWKDDTDAPDRIMVYKPDIGFVLGFITDYASQKERSLIAESAMWIYTTKKIYPHAATNLTLNKNESITARAYRSYFNRESFEEGLISKYIVKSDKSYFMFFDMSATKTFEIRLPEFLIGMNLEIYESKNATTYQILGAELLRIISTATEVDLGYLVLKFT